MTNKWIIQSFWSAPFSDDIQMLRNMALLSVMYCHRSGYKVKLYTDSGGIEILSDIPYDAVDLELNKIGDNVPENMLACGKFFALRKELDLYRSRDEHNPLVHVDIDVFLKKPCIDDIYNDRTIDLIVQGSEPFEYFEDYAKVIRNMYLLGYPKGCKLSWRQTFNVGVIGFNNIELLERYINNYFDALDIYTKNKVHQFCNDTNISIKDRTMIFDFVLEQQTIAYMSFGMQIKELLPIFDTLEVADAIGYQHLQGNLKWSKHANENIERLIKKYS